MVSTSHARRRVTSLAAVPLALCGALLLGGGCGGDGGDSSRPDASVISFDRAAMLQNVGENIVLPVYRDFDSKADSLATAVDAHCAALGTAGETTALEAAQAAWREVASAWQVAEPMLFGPAAMESGALRDRIYSWPLTSSCAVDQNVAQKRDDPGNYDISLKLVNTRGLDALEYLLFAGDLDTTCPSQVAPPGWDDLPEADRRAARCAFASDAASDLAAQSQIAVNAWDPAFDDFLADFTGAGQSGSAFDSAQDALNVVSDAMFYLDSEIKDMKLAAPAGIAMNRCTPVGSPCPTDLESRHAAHSRENIVANLKGFQMLYTGAGPDPGDSSGDGPGFEDFLRAAGATQLADTMRDDIAAAIAASEAIPSPMVDALTGDLATVTAAHSATKAVSDNLKSQFLTVLGLDIPDGAAADND